MNTVYTGAAIWALLISAVIVLIYKVIKILILKKKAKRINYYTEIVSGLLAVYMTVLLVITLWPSPGGAGRTINIYPFRDVYYTTKTQGLQGIFQYTVKICLLNILLFIPFGLLGVFAYYLRNKKRYVSIIGCGLLVTLLIESLQYILNTGRASDIDDVILNVLGVAIGVLFGKWMVRKKFSDCKGKSDE